MAENEQLIHRRGIFLCTFELEGFCQGLSQALAVGQAPGPSTKQYFRMLVEGATSIVVGPAKDKIPDIESDPSPADMLVVASVLRSLLTAFLTPDEREQQQAAQPWGLAAGARALPTG
jgi:hypothetical protein